MTDAPPMTSAPEGPTVLGPDVAEVLRLLELCDRAGPFAIVRPGAVAGWVFVPAAPRGGPVAFRVGSVST